MSGTLNFYRKELREMLRDRRVILTAIVSPLAAVILAFAGFALLASDIQKATTAHRGSPTTGTPGERLRIGVVGTGAGTLLGSIGKQAKSKLVQVTFYAFERVAAAEKELLSGHCDAVLVVAPEADQRIRTERTARVTLVAVRDRARSVRAARTLTEAIESLDRALVRQRMESRGLNPEAAHAIRAEFRPLSAPQPSAPAEPSVLSLFLPYLLVLAVFFGGVPTAFDSVAGEKERGTLETVLVSPIRRSELVCGKFLAVLSACVMAGMSSLAGVLLGAHSGVPALEPVIGDTFTWSPVWMSLAAMVPLGVFFSAALLIVSCYARNQREAQTYLMPLSLAVLLPAMYSIFGGFGAVPNDLGAALVPVYNCTALIRMQIDGGAPADFVLAALGSCSLYALVGVVLATRTFHRESVLLRV